LRQSISTSLTTVYIGTSPLNAQQSAFSPETHTLWHLLISLLLLQINHRVTWTELWKQWEYLLMKPQRLSN